MSGEKDMEEHPAVRDVQGPCEEWQGTVGHSIVRENFCEEYWRKWVMYRSGMEKYKQALQLAQETGASFANPLNAEEARVVEEMNYVFSHLRHMSISMQKTCPSSESLTEADIPSGQKATYNDKNLRIKALYGRKGKLASESDPTQNKLVFLAGENDGSSYNAYCVDPYFSDESSEEVLCVASATIESTMHYS